MLLERQVVKEADANLLNRIVSSCIFPTRTILVHFQS